MKGFIRVTGLNKGCVWLDCNGINTVFGGVLGNGYTFSTIHRDNKETVECLQDPDTVMKLIEAAQNEKSM